MQEINLKERLTELGDYVEIPALNEKEWGKFTIDDIFKVSGTVTTKPENLGGHGLIPRITCSSVNNGVDNFYQNPATEAGGVLTVDSATVGTIFYQPFDFIATDHVEKIQKKNGFLNEYVGLFLKTALSSSVAKKYQYGYKFSQKRIKQQIIVLPVNDSGEPDYAYMEQYSKNLMLRKYQQYLDFLDNRK